MENSHHLVMKVKHVNHEQTIQFEHKKMQYENTNAQAIHECLIANREADIHLEEAKVQAATKAFKMKQVEAEVLQLKLMMKGILPP